LPFAALTRRRELEKGDEARVGELSRRNLSQAATEELLRLVRSGDFRPGERLPTERGLMELFGVGRNTVREAVHALAAQGIVDVRPGRGVTVRSISTERAVDGGAVAALLDDRAVTDLYEFRRVIEVEAAARAAERSSPSDVQGIELCLGAFLHAYHERLPTWEEDVAFHRAIADASHNVIYALVLDLVNDKLVATRRETQRSQAVLARAAREHAAVFEAVKDRDAAAAGQAMARHIDSALWALGQARKRAQRDSSVHRTGTGEPRRRAGRTS
jgi:GntR family transcriptional repressor for pyruvate dehydrogenase complex